MIRFSHDTKQIIHNDGIMVLPDDQERYIQTSPRNVLFRNTMKNELILKTSVRHKPSRNNQLMFMRPLGHDSRCVHI